MKLTVEEAIEQGLITKVQVRFNGLNLKHCIMADEEAGVVEVHDFDMFRLLYNSHPIDYVPTKFMRGDVWILFKD